MITIVSSEVCPYCSMAKQLITSLGFEYTEKIVGIGSPELMEIVQKTGMMTVPQIFTGIISRETLIGGYTEIAHLQENGKLVDLLVKTK